jgi:hypothetical protein
MCIHRLLERSCKLIYPIFMNVKHFFGKTKNHAREQVGRSGFLPALEPMDMINVQLIYRREKR